MSFCYKKILGVFTHLRVTTPNIIEPKNYNRRKIFVYLFLIEKIQSGTPVHNWKRSFAAHNYNEVIK